MSNMGTTLMNPICLYIQIDWCFKEKRSHKIETFRFCLMMALYVNLLQIPICMDVVSSRLKVIQDGGEGGGIEEE